MRLGFMECNKKREGTAAKWAVSTVSSAQQRKSHHHIL